jgi:hypothetical protein
VHRTDANSPNIIKKPSSFIWDPLVDPEEKFDGNKKMPKSFITLDNSLRGDFVQSLAFFSS